MRRSGRLHRRRSELGRPGCAVPGPRREVGDDRGARPVAHGVDVDSGATPGVHVRTCSEVIGVAGSDHLESIRLRNNATGEVETVDAGFLFLFIGAAPRTDWLDGLVARDDHGFILSGPDLVEDENAHATWPLDRAPHHLETSVPGVYAAGDVRSQSA